LSVAAVQDSWAWPRPPVAARLAGAVGGVASGATIDVFMSVVISAALSTRRYTRTSSIRPLKYSPQTLLPPIRSGPVELIMFPEIATDETCAPLTYRRKVAPS
jgi:hypothetical protein